MTQTSKLRPNNDAIALLPSSVQHINLKGNFVGRRLFEIRYIKGFLGVGCGYDVPCCFQKFAIIYFITKEHT